MSTATLLAVLLVVYAVASLAISLYTVKLVGNSSDFMISGRQLSWVVTGFALAALAFSGAYVPLQVQMGYEFGWSGYLVFVTFVLALWIWVPILIKFWRRMGAYTQAEWVEYRFGLVTRAMLALTFGFAIVVNVAVQLIGMGTTLSGALGFSTGLTILIFGLIVILYVLLGGMWAVATIEVFQAIWVAFAFALLIPLALILSGVGLNVPLSNIPDGMPLLGLAVPAAFSYATLHLVLLSMGHYQVRATSIRSESDITKAWFLGGALILSVGLVMNWIGIYTRSIAPNIEPAAALGRLLQEVPPIVAAVALVGILAATMSTVSGIVIAASNSIVRDLLERFLGLRGGNATLRNRLTMLCFGVFSVVVAVLSPPGIAAYLVLFTAIAVPILFIHLDTAYIHKATKEGAVASLLIAPAFAFYWQVLAGRDDFIGTQNIAIPLVIVTLYGVSFIVKRITGPWWREQRDLGSTAADKVAEEDENLKAEVLSLVSAGRSSLADLTDSLEGLLASEESSFEVQSMSSSELARYIDQLSEQGFVRAKGSMGRDLVTYELTDGGANWLSRKGIRVSGLLDKKAQLVLSATAKIGNADIKTISNETELSSNEILPIVNQLERRGYVAANGLLRYFVTPTEAGTTLLNSNTETPRTRYVVKNDD